MPRDARSTLVGAGACAIAFVVLLGFAYGVSPAENLDARGLDSVASLHMGAIPDRLAHLGAYSANPAPIGAILVALVAWGWIGGRRREAVAAGALVVGANVLGQILKLVLAHPRVHPLLGVNQPQASAFPSGHATAAMSIALAAILVAPPRLRTAVAALVTVYVIWVSGSIVVLGWHFPSDVLGGLVFASGCFFCAVAWLRARRDRPAERSRARFSLPSELGWALALALAAAALTVAVARADELFDFARMHATAVATAATIAAAVAALMTTATLATDR